MKSAARILIVLSLTLGLSACFKDSAAKIMTIANNAKDIGVVEAALGRPDRIVNYGHQDDWEYIASDGRVAITVVNKTITHVRKED